MTKEALYEDLQKCEGAAFLFTVDPEGFVELTIVGDDIDDKNPEANVPSKLQELCCKTHIDIINWRSKNLKK